MQHQEHQDADEQNRWERQKQSIDEEARHQREILWRERVCFVVPS
jgi:hypothetical protein